MVCPGGPKTYAVAAHAAVRKPNGTGGYQTETGWGDGQRVVSKGNWATWFMINITCDEITPPPAPICETAFARALPDSPILNASQCFLYLDLDGVPGYDFNRWGWTNYIPTAGNYVFDVWAAAGQCETSNGTLDRRVYSWNLKK